MITKITNFVIVGTTLAVILYDIAAYIIGGANATISPVVYSWAQHEPIIGVGVGILIGHLFWSQRT